MSVSFNGFKVEPAPLINFSREFSRTGNGDIIGTLYNVQANGFLVAYKGSPTSSGTFNTGSLPLPDEDIQDASRLGAILRKQKALLELFGPENEYKLFEVQSRDGSQPIKFNPYNFSVSFQDGIWYEYCQYTISMLADSIYPFSSGFANPYLESASETWSIDQDVENFNPLNRFDDVGYLYKVNHSVSAKGKPYYDSDGTLISGAIENAKNWVRERLDFSDTIIYDPSGSILPPSYYNKCNQIRSENINNLEGEYSVNENWILSSGKVIEEFTVETNTSIDNFITISIQGNIIGLETRKVSVENSYYLSGILESKFYNASGFFDSISNSFLTRCQVYGPSGVTLNPIPIGSTIGKNPIAGTINYSYQYNNRPSGLIEGSKSETVSVTSNDLGSKVALIPVLGRTNGPVIQDLGTSDHLEKTLNIEFILGPSLNAASPATIRSSFEFPESKVATLVEILDPINNGAEKSKRQSPQKTWDPYTGRGSYSVTWIYE